MDLPILLYHHLVVGENVDRGQYEIPLSQFEEQLNILQRAGFETISFERLNDIIEGRSSSQRKVAIITFDDAFRSFYELALPALKRRGMRATVFVPAGEIGGTNRWDRANGVAPRELMTTDQLREIASEGMEIGSHGWRHRSLPGCSQLEADEELVRSREHLRALGHTANVFAYPYGKHSQACASMVEAAGYHAAVSIFSGAPSVTADRFAMRRIYVHPGDTAIRFRLKLRKLYLRYKAFRERWSAIQGS